MNFAQDAFYKLKRVKGHLGVENANWGHSARLVFGKSGKGKTSKHFKVEYPIEDTTMREFERQFDRVIRYALIMQVAAIILAFGLGSFAIWAIYRIMVHFGVA